MTPATKSRQEADTDQTDQESEDPFMAEFLEEAHESPLASSVTTPIICGERDDQIKEPS